MKICREGFGIKLCKNEIYKLETQINSIEFYLISYFMQRIEDG